MTHVRVEYCNAYTYRFVVQDTVGIPLMVVVIKIVTTTPEIPVVNGTFVYPFGKCIILFQIAHVGFYNCIYDIFAFNDYGLFLFRLQVIILLKGGRIFMCFAGPYRILQWNEEHSCCKQQQE